MIGLLVNLLIALMVKYDTEVKVRYSTVSKISLTLFSVLAVYIISRLNALSLNNIAFWLDVVLILTLLEFQSFFDIQTKEVYTFPTLVAMVFVVLNFLFRLNQYGFNGMGMTMPKVVSTLIFIVVLWLTTLFRGLGGGDLLLYMILAVHYMNYTASSISYLVLNFILSGIMFMLWIVPYTLISSKRDKEVSKHQPFTLFITIATIITLIA